jgi:hypothetical protein
MRFFPLATPTNRTSSVFRRLAPIV